MSTDISQIQLSESERQLLAELAERSGKSWPDVLNEALHQYGDAISRQSSTNGHEPETVFSAMTRLGLLGCLEGGPVDLSTNPAYMEGFGKDDR